MNLENNLKGKLSEKGQKLHEIQDAVFAIMLEVKSLAENDENEAIMLNLVTVSKGINSLRLKEITGDDALTDK